MNGLILLIPLALMCGLVALGSFFLALRNGQYDDLDGAAMRMLADGDED